MKTIKYIIGVGAAIAALASCTKEQTGTEPVAPEAKMVEVTLSASQAVTKTSMASNGNILWSEGDEIAVTYSTGTYTFALESGAGSTNATFKGMILPDSGDPVSATYPVGEVALGDAQKYLEGTFADNTLPMSATFENGGLVFSADAAVVMTPSIGGVSGTFKLTYTVGDTTYEPSMTLKESDNASNLIFVVVPGAQKFFFSNGSQGFECIASSVTEAGSRYILDAILPFYKDRSGIFHITSVEGLYEFAQNANDGADYAGKTIVLDTDIDLKNEDWTPINVKSAIFDGNDHTISNVTASGEKIVGLFGKVDMSTIKNLTVDGATISGINHVAALAAHGVCLKVENCTVKNATVISSVKDGDDGDKAGALVGYISGESVAWVKGCTVENCTVTAYRDLAALVGYANGAAEVTGNTVKECNVICDKSENYNNYTSNAQYDAHEVVGEAAAKATVDSNNVSNVTVSFIPVEPFYADEEGVYHITSVEGIKIFAQNVNNGSTTYSGKTVLLEEDIDLAGIDWTPIGSVASYPSITFSGVFDGQNHVISNMTATDMTPDYSTAGLFGSIIGTVKNVTLKNVTVKSSHYAGAVVGYTSSNAAVIENCHVIGGTVTSLPELIGGSYDNGDKVGGLVGYIVGGDMVTNCTVEGLTVTAYRDLGGLVGYANGSSTVKDNTVKDCQVICDRSHNYKNYTSNAQYDAHEVVGEAAAAAIIDSNNVSNVTVSFIPVEPFYADEDGVYHITSVEGIMIFAQNVNNGSTTYSGKTVLLEEDIDLAGIAWTPIGGVTSYPSVTFGGTFDGQNHVISNMTTTDLTPNHASAGLFGSITGTVKNVTLKNVTVKSSHYAGAVVGYSSTNGCTIDNCHVIGGTVASTPEMVGEVYDNGDKVGGIIGYIVNGDKVTNCSVENVTITAYRDLGGIVGCATGSAVGGVTDNTVKDCTVIQDNTNAYMSSVTTFEAIIGRHDNAIPASNVAINVTVSSR